MTEMFASTDHVNVRSTPGFGDNRIGSLHLCQSVTVTGPQQGDRWLPVTADLAGTIENGFVSKNVLRAAESGPKEALIKNCIDQWLFFNRGTGKEHIGEFVARVGVFWASIGIDLDGADRDVPWSAAFISWAVKNAGPSYDGFRFAAAHSRYVNRAIIRREAGDDHPYWGMRIQEHKPALGDMVCRWRQSPVTYDQARASDRFKSHCDIVVKIEDGKVFTIGGNVSHSVRHTRYEINSSGFLTGAGNVYAVLANRR